MKFWYYERFDMYVPTNTYWEDDVRDKELVEVEVEKEELILNGGSNNPYNHAGRWESIWWEDGFEHSIMNKIPWPPGKYKITIEPILDEDGEEVK